VQVEDQRRRRDGESGSNAFIVRIDYTSRKIIRGEKKKEYGDHSCSISVFRYITRTMRAPLVSIPVGGCDSTRSSVSSRHKSPLTRSRPRRPAAIACVPARVSSNCHACRTEKERNKNGGLHVAKNANFSARRGIVSLAGKGGGLVQGRLLECLVRSPSLGHVARDCRNRTVVSWQT
jgi:hypothetical protein